jgi:hypothetical protein
MANPLHRLKFLPWRSLFLISSLVTLIFIVLDLFLTLGYNSSPAIARVINLLYGGSLGVLVQFGVVVGVGALAVYLLEKLFPNVMLNTSVLWALVLCLVVCLLIRSLLPIPPDVLVNLDDNQVQLMGFVIGVFWKGRPYWR